MGILGLLTTSVAIIGSIDLSASPEPVKVKKEEPANESVKQW